MLLVASSTSVSAQPAAADDCPTVSQAVDTWVLQCGTDADTITLTAPNLSTGHHASATLTQGDYTTPLVLMASLGGVTHSPVWRYLSADGSQVCQLDGRPSPSGDISRACMNIDDSEL